MTTTFAMVPDAATATALTRELACDLIELYGAFTPAGAGFVVEAADNRIPVGVLAYGPPA
jgi:Family of unknown function (DUF6506)